MFTKKLFVVFMAVAMIFSIFAFSTFAVYRSATKDFYEWWMSHSNSEGAAGATNGEDNGTVDSFLAVEFVNGDWRQKEASGSTTSITIAYDDIVLSVCSEHDFYDDTGSYVETHGFDFYYGEDF